LRRLGMGIRYENLNDATRTYMLQEIALGGHYISPRLKPEGNAAWSELLREGAQSYTDDWIGLQLLTRGYFLDSEFYTRGGKTFSIQFNKEHAAQQLAEGEFNRYYIRALCLRAKDDGKDSLVIYRGKEVREPRPESEAKIGRSISIDVLLPVLRSNDFVTIEAALGVPGGPSSGLTCRLP
jgi:hypothetical protein